jgi:hypothetical protein
MYNYDYSVLLGPILFFGTIGLFLFWLDHSIKRDRKQREKEQ